MHQKWNQPPSVGRLASGSLIEAGKLDTPESKQIADKFQPSHQDQCRINEKSAYRRWPEFSRLVRESILACGGRAQP